MPHVLTIARAIVEENADTAAAIHAAGTAKVQAMPLADKDATPAKTYVMDALVDAKEIVAAVVLQHLQDESRFDWEVRKTSHFPII